MNFTKGLPRPAAKDELVGIDTEFFGMTRPHRADGTFAALTIAYPNGDAYIVTRQSDIAPALKRVAGGTWVMHNALFDLRALRRYVDIKQRYVHDTMLVEQDLFGGWYGDFSLADLNRRWIGERLEKEVRADFSGRESMTPEMETYAVQDALATVRIAQKQIDYINEHEDGQFEWYYEIDEPALWAVLDMPPVRVDVKAWRKNIATLQVEAGRLEEDLGFNAYSHVQVKKQIEKALGHGIKNTNASDTLLPLLRRLVAGSKEYRLVQAVLDVREARKAVETFGENWIEKHVEEGDLVYPSWRVTGAETGRMSCADPNLQQVPVRKMNIFRSFFTAPPGQSMLVADASQQEVRLAAALSKDERLIQELNDGVDLHQVTADMFGVDRDRGKAINLGLNYGMSEYGLAEMMGISEEEAEAGIRARERRYKGLAAWQNMTVNKAQRQLKVRSLSGRPIWINPYLQYDGWKRNAINGPVQASAADHTKRALVAMHQMCEDEGVPFGVCMAVHDEIVSNVPVGMMKTYKKIAKDAWREAGVAMTTVVELPIETASGRSWACKS